MSSERIVPAQDIKETVGNALNDPIVQVANFCTPKSSLVNRGSRAFRVVAIRSYFLARLELYITVILSVIDMVRVMVTVAQHGCVYIS